MVGFKVAFCVQKAFTFTVLICIKVLDENNEKVFSDGLLLVQKSLQLNCLPVITQFEFLYWLSRAALLAIFDPVQYKKRLL